VSANVQNHAIYKGTVHNHIAENNLQQIFLKIKVISYFAREVWTSGKFSFIRATVLGNQETLALKIAQHNAHSLLMKWTNNINVQRLNRNSAILYPAVL